MESVMFSIVLGSIWMIFTLGWLFTLRWSKLRVERNETRLGCIEATDGRSGSEVARFLLDTLNLHHTVDVVQAEVDSYRHRGARGTPEVRLCEQVYRGCSVYALSVAAHEVGHAQQYAEGYWASHRTVRRILDWTLMVGLSAGALGGIAGVVSALLGTRLPSGVGLLFMAVSFLGMAPAVFRILALERNASARAMRFLRNGIIQESEVTACRHALKVAGMTYVVHDLGQTVYAPLAIGLSAVVVPIFGELVGK